MPSASHLAHEGLPFANPMAEDALDGALRALRLPEGARVLETGCGTGELLLRALELDPTRGGMGVDLDPDAIAVARRRAAELLPGRDVVFDVRDAADVSGRFHAVINIASSHAHGGFPAALGALRGLVVDGGAVVYGEGYWRTPPTPAFLEALGGATEDELPDLQGLHEAVQRAGFEVLRETTASVEDFAAYEEALAANAERHGTEETLAYARRIRERRALPEGGHTLGFAVLVLRSGRR